MNFRLWFISTHCFWHLFCSIRPSICSVHKGSLYWIVAISWADLGSQKKDEEQFGPDLFFYCDKIWNGKIYFSHLIWKIFCPLCMYVNLWAFEKVNFQINVFTIFVIIEKMVLIFFFFILSFAIQECILFKSKNLYRLRVPKMLSLSYDNTLLELCLT